MAAINVNRLITAIKPLIPYFKELEGALQFAPANYIQDFVSIVNDDTNSPEIIKRYLSKEFANYIDYSITVLIPLLILDCKLIHDRPSILYKKMFYDLDDKPGFVTIDELYETLKCFPEEESIELLKKIGGNIYDRGIIIRSFRDNDIEKFSSTIYRLLSENDKEINIFIRKVYGIHYLWNSLDLFLNEANIEALCMNNDIISENDLSDFTGLLIENFIRHTIDISDPDDEEDLANLLELVSKFYAPIIYSYDAKDFYHRLLPLIEELGLFNFSVIIAGLSYWATAIAIGFFYMIKDNLYKKENELYNKIIGISPYSLYITFCSGLPKDIFNYWDEYIKEKEPDSLTKLDISDNNRSLSSRFLPNDFFDTKHRIKEDTEYICPIRDFVIQKGVDAISEIINFIAENGFIDNTDSVKRNFAYRLTGFYKEYEAGIINWNGETRILSVLIQAITDIGNKWENLKKYIKCENKVYNNLKLSGKSIIDKEFKDLFLRLYEINLPITGEKK